MVRKIKNPRKTVRIAIVGKYVDLRDSYKSLAEALTHGGIAHEARVETNWVDAERLLEEGVSAHLAEADGILVPGGFGDRGIQGKIEAIRYARQGGVPFLGICLGLQCAVIEFARHMAGLADANSAEFDRATPHPVIDLLPEQRDIGAMGGTMRLGLYPIALVEDSLAARVYGRLDIEERHRHRYEVSNEYRRLLEKNGFRVSGIWPEKQLVEIVELPDHPWFIAGQFHPEFRSRPWAPHPLFAGFVGAAIERRDRR
jgi:CTP synthase